MGFKPTGLAALSAGAAAALKVAVSPQDVLDRRFFDYAVQQVGLYQRPGN